MSQVKHRGYEEESERIQSVIQTIKSVKNETVKRGRPPGVGIVYCSYVKTVGCGHNSQPKT